MKKRLLPICSIALVGIVLASCGGNTNTGNISYTKIHPEALSDKGNSVTHVNIVASGSTYGLTYNYDLDNQMKFDEVAEELSGDFYNYVGNDVSAYSYSNKIIKDYTIENDYKFINSIGFVPMDKEVVKSELYESSELYRKRTSSNGTTTTRAYQRNLEYLSADLLDSSENVNSVTKIETKSAKEYSYTSGIPTIEEMKYAYSLENDTTMDAKSQTNKGNANTYISKSYYIGAKEQSDYKNYDKTFISYDKANEETVSYTISLDYGLNLKEFSANYGITIRDIYNSSFPDLYTTSYELTENYIILKTFCNFTKEVYDKAYSNADSKYISPSSSQIEEELKTLIDGEYKGSKSNCELWLKYNSESIKIAYYNADFTTNYNINKQYEESDFTSQSGYYPVQKYVYEYKDLVGKQYTKKGKASNSITISISEKGFEDKINNLFSSCEKNNQYKDLNFIPS